MKLFRWHRGSLEDSMATAVQCSSMESLVTILRTGLGLEDVTAERVDVKPYGYDERIEWDTYLVTVDGNAVGMTDGDPAQPEGEPGFRAGFPADVCDLLVEVKPMAPASDRLSLASEKEGSDGSPS